VTVLLDIDGVLVTTPAWKVVEQHADGFMQFNERAADNLAKLLDKTQAAVVLITTHRISYSEDDWITIFRKRNINASTITKINKAAKLEDIRSRAEEIEAWVLAQADPISYVIIDDDLSLNALPEHIKRRCILTKPMIGIDQSIVDRAMCILQQPA
jgi:FMN phosphatase YigB (HAD superfamily)